MQVRVAAEIFTWARPSSNALRLFYRLKTKQASLAVIKTSPAGAMFFSEDDHAA
jgi:hypothetical protein